MNKLKKRFYIKKVGDSISIYHRPSHQLIWSGKLDEEGREKVNKFINMSRNEFYSYILDNNIDITPVWSYSTQNSKKEKEEWLNGAWEYTTRQVLKYYNLDVNSIPLEEEPTREYLVRLKESLAENRSEVEIRRKKKLLKKKSSRPSVLHELKRRNKKSSIKKVGKSPTKK